MKWYILLLLSFNVFAQNDVKTIECGNGQCFPDFHPPFYQETDDTSVIDLGVVRDSDVSVILPNNYEPRNLMLFLRSEKLEGNDALIDLRSKKKETDSANFVLIGDVFDSLQLNLSGYSGQNGVDASVLCAERFMSGAYGVNSRLFFENRRNNDPTLSYNRCDNLDVSHIASTKFSCDESYYDIRPTPNVEASRIQYRQSCVGSTVKSRCINRKVRLDCRWHSLGVGFAGGGKSCPNRWGGISSCQYSDLGSCWNHQDKQQTYSSILSTPPSGHPNPWSISYDSSLCRPDLTHGGAVATNINNVIDETVYQNYAANNRLDELCGNIGGPTGPAWRFESASMELTEPGLDPDTQEPVPGSLWNVDYTGFFQGCSSLGPYLFDAQIVESWQTYGNANLNCSDAFIPEDTNRQIQWTPAGLVQEPTFGVERVICTTSSCSENLTVVNKTKAFDEIDPTVGANGTKNGKGFLFIYDYGANSTIVSQSGASGVGGNNDLSQITQARYCANVFDANSHGLDSSYAKKPQITFEVYNWLGLDLKSGKPSGSDNNDDNELVILKKLSPSALYLIKNVLLEQ